MLCCIANAMAMPNFDIFSIGIVGGSNNGGTKYIISANPQRMMIKCST